MFYYLKSFCLAFLFAFILQLELEGNRLSQKLTVQIKQSVPGSYINQVATMTATQIQKLIGKASTPIKKMIQSHKENIERNQQILEERRKRIEEGLDPNLNKTDKE